MRNIQALYHVCSILLSVTGSIIQKDLQEITTEGGVNLRTVARVYWRYLKFTKTKPIGPFFSIDRDTGIKDSHISASDNEALPLVLEVIGCIFLFILAFLAALCFRSKFKTIKHINIIKGDAAEMRPLWIYSPPKITYPCNLGWDREETGHAIVFVNSRTLKLKPETSPFSHSGAKYNKGFQKGRHIFAFMWPRDQKMKEGNDHHLEIGVGYPYHKQEMSIDFARYYTGATKKNLAFNLISNKISYDGNYIESYPRGKSKNFCVPTLFYMYLDMDQGKLYFSSENEFWGVAFNFGKLFKSENRGLYPMVSCHGIEGKLMLFYKGEVTSEAEFVASNRDTTLIELGEAACGNMGQISKYKDNQFKKCHNSYTFMADECKPSTSNVQKDHSIFYSKRQDNGNHPHVHENVKCVDALFENDISERNGYNSLNCDENGINMHENATSGPSSITIHNNNTVKKNIFFLNYNSMREYGKKKKRLSKKSKRTSKAMSKIYTRKSGNLNHAYDASHDSDDSDFIDGFPEHGLTCHL